MHDGNNEDFVGTDLVNDAVRDRLVLQRRVRLESGAHASGY